MTSGTTGASKYIPVTPESRAAKSQLVRMTIYSIYKAHPKTLSGKILSVVSCRPFTSTSREPVSRA